MKRVKKRNFGPFLIAIDQGTTGTTTLLFDRKARVIAKAYREIRQYYPRPGWVEHDPQEIFRSVVDLVREILKKAKIPADAVAAIGITNQRETSVIWDRKSGKPVHRAIVWQCRRTTEICDRLKDRGYETLVKEKTGLLIDPYFSATKLNWVLTERNAHEKARRGALACGTIDTWLVWNLTRGEHATDPTNASRTLLYDIDRREWSDELCETFGVPKALLPEVRPSSGEFGRTHPKLFGHPIPILGIAGDQQAALFGHEAFDIGQAKCTFGTGAFMVSYCGTKRVVSNTGLLTTLACDREGKAAYALEGSIFMAGAIVQWLRDEMKWISKAAETTDIFRKTRSAQGVHLIPAFVGMGAPYWKAQARGAILGLSRGSNSQHVIRAALESIAFQTHDLARAMEKDLRTKIAELNVDGGVAVNSPLMQFLADISDCRIRRPGLLEMTALGAARLAALSAGLWSPKDRQTGGKKALTFTPKMNAEEREKRISGWNGALRTMELL